MKMIRLYVVIAALTSSGSAFAERGFQKWHIDGGTSPTVIRTAFDFLVPERPKAVLVLVPGANGDGSKYLNETNWTGFAEKKGWAVVSPTFVSPDELLKRNSGYYDMSSGSDGMLISALKEMGLDSLPIYIFGFSGGARFTAAFAIAHPFRVAGWVTQASSDGVAIRGHGDSPGVVACGSDDGRMGACLSWFKDVRAVGRHVMWVEIPNTAHARSVGFEDFVRSWFSEVERNNRDRDKGVWVDLGDGLPIKGASPCSEANRGWLPSAEAYDAWRKVVFDDSRRIVSRRMFTHSDKCPHLTVYLYRPPGVVTNVLCLSLLANRPADVELCLRRRNRRGTVGRFLNFADTNRLAVVAWGAPRGLWKPRYNWDGIGHEEGRHLSRSFGYVAKSWEKVVDVFSKEYSIPSRGYLMAGFSGSAQFAQRLALHCPDRFAAAAIHIASSYDYPLPAGKRILWCVTTGENESGYDRSLSFLAAAAGNGYSVVYKAYPGLGHQDSMTACELGCLLFSQVISKGRDAILNVGRWPIAADVVNQTWKPRSEAAAIPDKFRIYLPNEALATAWMKE